MKDVLAFISTHCVQRLLFPFSNHIQISDCKTTTFYCVTLLLVVVVVVVAAANMVEWIGA